MYYVWVGNLRVAGSTNLQEALYYAYQYREEGEVRVKCGNKILAILSGKVREGDVYTNFRADQCL